MKISKGKRAYLLERMDRFAFYFWGDRVNAWGRIHLKEVS